MGIFERGADKKNRNWERNEQVTQYSQMIFFSIIFVWISWFL
jgi:hypothetical protein